MPNPFAMRFVEMERKWDYWLVMMETRSLMMDAVLLALLIQDINAVEEQYLLQIFAVKFAETVES